jgi:hypothetical protein
MFKEIEKIFRKKEAIEEKSNNCFECKYFQTKSSPYCKYWKAYIYYFKACDKFYE